MKEKKKKKRTLTFEEHHRLEKRLKGRSNTIAQTQHYREQRIKKSDEREIDKCNAKIVLTNDNKKEEPDKKLATGKLIAAFSFIPYGLSPYEKRQEILADYKPRSFNEIRQYTDFVKRFIYPYKIPTSLLLTVFQEECFIDEHGRKVKTQWAEIIRLSKKWICDIVSGQSFHQRNKEYLTKTESHIFLNTVIPYTGANTVLETYFLAKCAARKIENKRCKIIAKVFVEKFANYFTHHTLTGFLDLLARNVGYNVDYGQLSDICDFISAKVLDGWDKIHDFSFSGRTMASVVALANEWHAQIQQEQEACNGLLALCFNALRDERQQNEDRHLSEKLLNKSWAGLPICDFTLETDACIWTIKQLHSVCQLLNEGRKMKNCVASYSNKCTKGESHIFNVSCVFRDIDVTENKATLEVNASRSLVQAKGKCNAQAPRETMSVINRWAQTNRIKVSV
jgi:hypothetical protein